MAFVPDISTAIAWALNESDRVADEARERPGDDQAFVPALWWFELRNALVINERRGRITEQQSGRFPPLPSPACGGGLGRGRLPIIVDTTMDENGVLSLARRHRLTVYDAAYLELAIRSALPLATLDALLAAAARSDGIPVFGDEGE